MLLFRLTVPGDPTRSALAAIGAPVAPHHQAPCVHTVSTGDCVPSYPLAWPLACPPAPASGAYSPGKATVSRELTAASPRSFTPAGAGNPSLRRRGNE